MERIFLLCFVIMATSVDEGDFVYSTAASDWSLSPSEEYVTALINITYFEGEKLHTEKTDLGKFGTGKVGPASGLVVHVTSLNRNDSHFGCDFPYGNQVPNEPWIALVKRGNCTFDEKLRNAYKSNASALVVYAKEEKETLDRMNFKDCNYCNIPTVYTYRWKGEEIARNVERGKVYMYITVGETVSRPYSGINRTSVLFVSISFIVLMIISLAWLVFYYVQRFRYLHAKDRLAQRLCNAAKKALAKIPTRNIKLTDKEISGEGDCCAVCIELYRSGETLRTLPCRHEFHKSCVDPWLLEHRTCPMCKMDILKHYGFILTGSQESILHLDMEEGVLNPSESQETDSPSHDGQRHHHPYLTGTSSTTTTATHVQSADGEHQSSQCPFERTTSVVSLTVISTPNGSRRMTQTKAATTDTKKSPSSLSSEFNVSSSHPLSNSREADELDSSKYPSQTLKSEDSHHCVPVTVHLQASSEDSLQPASPRSLSNEKLNPDECMEAENPSESDIVANLNPKTAMVA